MTFLTLEWGFKSPNASASTCIALSSGRLGPFSARWCFNAQVFLLSRKSAKMIAAFAKIRLEATLDIISHREMQTVGRTSQWAAHGRGKEAHGPPASPTGQEEDAQGPAHGPPIYSPSAAYFPK
ncbi:hypothetical protein N7471_013041 [Penicillium samsonianum]|uniref:uncharacterized protein n=1 Tax=Penicillium samsonianum TaxID=1882272 RepID=UPI0025480BED|nr:uncharacterized protein N7471_013041 [Penicillium samsonianum]KAJ6119090.1 hypothetical protein N7471_013041 [Penicillium samsonianum]